MNRDDFDAVRITSIGVPQHPSNTALVGATAVLFLLHTIILIRAMTTLPVHWDEGWNFCVARSWLELDHYGCLFLGEPTSARLSTGIAAVLPAKIGFQLFGIGIWQGRAFVAAEALIALVALFAVSVRLFGKRVGFLTLLILLLISQDQRVHPMLLGSLDLGEIPMILYVIFGYLSLIKGLDQRAKALIFIPLACSFFGFALCSKHQLWPFLTLALALPGCLIFSPRLRTIGALFLLVLLGSFCVSHMIGRIQLPSRLELNMTGGGTEGLLSAVALVFDLRVRLIVLKYVLINYWFIILCLMVFGMQLSRRGLKAAQTQRSSDAPVVLSLYVLVASWTIWFLAASIQFPRYFAPAAILASPLVAQLLGQWLADYDLSDLVHQMSFYLRRPRILFRKREMAVVIAIAWSVTQALTTILSMVSILTAEDDSNSALYEVASFINRSTNPDAVIETYDVQIFFLLQRAYRYPPDQINIDSILDLQRESSSVEYNPFDGSLGSIPNFILRGPWSGQVYNLYGDIDVHFPGSIKRSFGEFDLWEIR